MDPPVLQLRPHLRHQHLHLLGLPLQPSRQQAQADAFEALEVRQQLELARFLERLVLRPRVRGRFEQRLLDVDKACFLEPGKVVRVAGHGTVVFGRRFGDEGGPVAEAAGGEETAVVGGETAVEFLQFEVAAGFGVPERQSVCVSDLYTGAGD